MPSAVLLSDYDGGVCPYSSNATTTVATSASSSGVIGGNSSTSASTTAAPTNAIKLSSGVSITISKDIIKIVQDVLNQKGYDCGTVDGSINVMIFSSLFVM